MLAAEDCFLVMMKEYKQKESATSVIWSPWIILWKQETNIGLNSNIIPKKKLLVYIHICYYTLTNKHVTC